MTTEVDELLRIATTKGKHSVWRWVHEHMDALKSGVLSADALYVALKQQCIGAALEFAYVLPKDVEAGLAKEELRSETKNHACWVTGIAHIFSDFNIQRARRAFEEGDVLSGLRRYYAGGRGPTAVAFASFDCFETYLRSARAGDDFMLESLHELSERGALLEPSLPAVLKYLELNPREEVLLVKKSSPPDAVEVVWRGREEEDDLAPLFGGDGLFVYPFIWEKDSEFFIDAKVPNAQGAVPLGGPY